VTGTWGVGSYVTVDVDGRPVRRAWRVGHDEIGRDTAAAARWLEAVAIRPGGRLLVASMLSEAAQAWPLMLAALARGVQLTLTDATAAEAPRLRVMLRSLRHDAVVGVTDGLVDALAAGGHLDLLLDVPLVAARPGGWERLAAAGRPVHRWCLLGPAVACSIEPGGVAGVDPGEWALGRDGERVTVTGVAPRLEPVRELPAAVAGEVRDAHTLVPQPLGPDLPSPGAVGDADPAGADSPGTGGAAPPDETLDPPREVHRC
jgi:hypothetical protein